MAKLSRTQVFFHLRKLRQLGEIQKAGFHPGTGASVYRLTKFCNTGSDRQVRPPGVECRHLEAFRRVAGGVRQTAYIRKNGNQEQCGNPDWKIQSISALGSQDFGTASEASTNLGPVSKAYRAVDPTHSQAAASVVMRQAQGSMAGEATFPDRVVLPGVMAWSVLANGPLLFRGETVSFLRAPDAGNPHVRCDERGVETDAWWRRQTKGPATDRRHLNHRATPRLHHSR